MNKTAKPLGFFDLDNEARLKQWRLKMAIHSLKPATRFPLRLFRAV